MDELTCPFCGAAKYADSRTFRCGTFWLGKWGKRKAGWARSIVCYERQIDTLKRALSAARPVGSPVGPAI
jgi:hypothetical protein